MIIIELFILIMITKIVIKLYNFVTHMRKFDITIFFINFTFNYNKLQKRFYI